MKLGPVHVLSGATFRRLITLHDLWAQVLGSMSGSNPMAACVFEHSHGLLHSPLCARVVPAILPLAPTANDAADLAATERLIAAYRLAMKERVAPPAPSMWDRIGKTRADFIRALGRGDVETIQASLSRLFTSNLVVVLGHFHPDHVQLLQSNQPTHLHMLFSDALVSLAEAIGAAHVTNVHQELATHVQPLNRDFDALYRAVVARLGFDLSFPAVGSAFGFRVGGQLHTTDGVVHSYTAQRLRQLGGPGASVAEIGGGYGCLALMAHRAGLAPYAVFDLPWVNALQGYFLIRALPAGSVRLYGESTGDIRVLPYYALETEPDKSFDVLVNSDSLPEMGRATAAEYLRTIRRITRGVLLSINQEAMARVAGMDPQNCVRELVEDVGGFVAVSRHRAWMRHGYVEKVFRPA